MSLAAQSVTLPNGVTLDYVAQGDPHGLPVLLLHGYTDSWRSFERLLARLPPSIRAIAPSQRGHGDSSRPERGYRPADFAGDLPAFMDALNIRRAVVLGHSMGSQVALRFALDYPAHTLGLVLVGACPTFRDNPDVQDMWDSVVANMADPVDPGFVLDFQKSTLARFVPPGFLTTVVTESLKLPARVWRATLEGLLEEDFSAEFGRLRMPTAILWGDRDAFCSRADQDALTGSLPDATLGVYRGAGHAPHWEQPARVAADLAAFVQQRIWPQAEARSACRRAA